MAVYDFKGMNSKGQNVRGQVEADSLSLAQLMIKRKGIYLISIKDRSRQKSISSLFHFLKKVDVKTLSVTTRNLASLLKSGISLVDALETVSKQTVHPTMAEALNYVKDSVNAGKSFHKSLEKFPNIFNKTFSSMCEAGELSGTLDSILIRLAVLIEDQSKLQDKVRSALIYPAIMTVFSFFMVIFLLTYVVPKIRVLFEESTVASIPWYSAFLLSASDFLRQYWLSMALAFVLCVLALWKWKNSAVGQKMWDNYCLKIPVFGRLIRAVIVSRMSRTLSTLLKGGVTVVDALDIVKNVVNNHKIHNVLVLAKESIERGNNLSTPLVHSGEFPPMVTQMIRVGEKTGQLEKMLSQISETYDSQIRTELDTLTSMLEPAMLIIMGGIIAFIVFSIMVPLLQMYNLSGVS